MLDIRPNKLYLGDPFDFTDSNYNIYFETFIKNNVSRMSVHVDFIYISFFVLIFHPSFPSDCYLILKRSIKWIWFCGQKHLQNYLRVHCVIGYPGSLV